MAGYNKINQFVQDIAQGVHNLATGVATVALTTMVNKPTAASTVLAGLTQIVYTNLGSRVPAITSCTQTSGTLKYILADLIMTASGAVAAFGAVVLYNDTPTAPADPLICWWEYGSDVTLASGETFTVDFDNVAGVLQIN